MNIITKIIAVSALLTSGSAFAASHAGFTEACCALAACCGLPCC